MIELENPRTKLLNVEREFNRVRYDLYEKVDRFFRQSIASNYVTEDDILEKLEECKKLRKKYFALRDELGIYPMRKA